MTAVSKDVYFDDLDVFVDEYKNTYHRNIKTKPIDVKSESFPEYYEESIKRDPKFKV